MTYKVIRAGITRKEDRANLMSGRGGRLSSKRPKPRPTIDELVTNSKTHVDLTPKRPESRLTLEESDKRNKRPTKREKNEARVAKEMQQGEDNLATAFMTKRERKEAKDHAGYAALVDFIMRPRQHTPDTDPLDLSGCFDNPAPKPTDPSSKLYFASEYACPKCERHSDDYEGRLFYMKGNTAYCSKCSVSIHPDFFRETTEGEMTRKILTTDPEDRPVIRTKEEVDRANLERILEQQGIEWLVRETLEGMGAANSLIEFVQTVVNSIEASGVPNYMGYEDIMKALAKLMQPQGLVAAEFYLAEALFNITGRRI